MLIQTFVNHRNRILIVMYTNMNQEKDGFLHVRDLKDSNGAWGTIPHSRRFITQKEEVR